MSDLGKWLREQIERRGLTQNAAAVYSGVGPATISDIINKNHIPRVDTLFQLADYFGTPREAVLRLAGHLPAATGDGNDPELDALVLEIQAIWRQIKQLDKPTADRLARLAMMQAEMAEAALRANTGAGEEAPAHCTEGKEKGEV